MGLIASEPPKPDVDVLPPRIETLPSSLDRVGSSPFTSLFGVDERRALFGANYARPGTAQLSFSLSPDDGERLRVGVGAEVGPGTAGTGIASSRLRMAFGDNATSQANVDVWMGNAMATFAHVSKEHGLGVSAVLPLSAVRAARSAGGEGGAFGGVAASEVVGATSADPVESGMGSKNFLQGPAAVAEVGVWKSLFEGRGAVGAHVGASRSVPTKVWALGQVGEGLTVGAQVSGRVGSLARAGWRPSGVNVAGGGGEEGVQVDVGVGVHVPATYDASLVFFGAQQELVASYVHSLTTRRSILNPFEEKNVKGIYSYTDLGVEFRQRIGGALLGDPQPQKPGAAAPVAPEAPEVSLGLAYQANRAVLVKGKVGTHESAASVVLRSWGDPIVTLAATASVDRASLAPRLGLALSVLRGTKVEYRKALRGQQHSVRSRVFAAREDLNDTRDPLPAADPFRDAPAPATKLPGRFA